MLNHIKQAHETGCFVACAAVLLDCTYAAAFKEIFPHRTMPHQNDYEDEVSLSLEEALAKLGKLGIKLKKANLKCVKSLDKRTALVIIKWRALPTLMHAFVYDGISKRWLDPLPARHATKQSLLKEIQNNLEAIYYIENSKQYFENIRLRRARTALANNRMVDNLGLSA